MVKSRYIRDGHPTFNRSPCNGYINPYYWVDEFIPYMEIMGVDRPDRTYKSQEQKHIGGYSAASGWAPDSD